MTRSTSLMLLLHLTVNAVVLSAGYYWLGLSESRTATLIWSGFLAVLLVLFACWNYAAALAYFRDTSRGGIAGAWRSGLRNLAPFGLAVAMIAAALLLMNPGLKKAPTALQWAVRVVQWVVLPVLLLPMLSAISEQGWRGFRAVGSKAAHWLYWLQAPLLVLLTIRIPLLLLAWIPHLHTFSAQAVSFAARASLAYLLFGLGWLMLAFVTSAGKPRLTQSITTASP